MMLWNYRKENKVNIKVFSEHDDAINKIIAVNKKYIFSASSDRTIKKWTKDNERS